MFEMLVNFLFSGILTSAEMSFAVTAEFSSSKAIISCRTVPFLSGGINGPLAFFIDRKNSFTSDYGVSSAHYNGRTSAVSIRPDDRPGRVKRG